jgi:hypothetical protein
VKLVIKVAIRTTILAGLKTIYIYSSYCLEPLNLPRPHKEIFRSFSALFCVVHFSCVCSVFFVPCDSPMQQDAEI